MNVKKRQKTSSQKEPEEKGQLNLTCETGLDPCAPEDTITTTGET